MVILKKSILFLWRNSKTHDRKNKHFRNILTVFELFIALRNFLNFVNFFHVIVDKNFIY